MCARTQIATKTIGLDQETYDRLRAEKRAGESFSDTVKRLTDEVAADWRHGLGKYEDQAAEFETAVRHAAESTAEGLARRQDEVIDQLGADEG